ncbi:Transcriptional regulatory protein sin3 [Chytridiales sp. JEL 0842]|nr:Transcriptional regulatory protein sin3 [Chytridiales sp. JEL 0842]
MGPPPQQSHEGMYTHDPRYHMVQHHPQHPQSSGIVMAQPPSGPHQPHLPPIQNSVATPPMPPAQPPAAAASQPTPESQDPNYRPLNVKDALSYLDQVKLQFQDQPDVYNQFLDIMKDFKSQSIDTPGVIERVSTLFRGHPALIMGFNTFLPPGYKIEVSSNPLDPIRVTTPQTASSASTQYHILPGTTVANSSITHSHTVHGHPPTHVTPNTYYSAAPHADVTHPVQHTLVHALPTDSVPAPLTQQQIAGNASPDQSTKPPVEFNQAISYVNKIKNRFAAEPDIYKRFLEILQTYQKEGRPIQEVYGQVSRLFEDAPDLLDEFKQFLPDPNAPAPLPPAPLEPRRATGGRKAPKRGAVAANSSGPGHPPPKKRAKGAQAEIVPPEYDEDVQDARNEAKEELEWIDKCKKVIGNKLVYNEFLKVLNLFSQEVIDAKTLVERVEPFLTKSTELFEWFKRFVKYDEDLVVQNVAAEPDDLDWRTLPKVGTSYRILPSTFVQPVCSGRDDLCNEVLNDSIVLGPSYAKFDPRDNNYRKSQFEEALHKCEEERYEFNSNIEGNLHTIALLEPIYRKIQNMTPEEKISFKLPIGLGSNSKVYQRIIKKIYEPERGVEILDALHSNPTVAVPVVLKRLKQKDEEWKRSQREWNKVWREIDNANYQKSLDHQGVTFRASDKKSLSLKHMVMEIQNLANQQKQAIKRLLINSKASSDTVDVAGRPKPVFSSHHLEFTFKDAEIFRDARKLIMSQVTNTTGMSQANEDRIGEFLATFVRRFFFVESSDDPAVLVPHGTVNDDEDDPLSARGRSVSRAKSSDVEEDTSAVNGVSKSANGLRKEVLVKAAGVANIDSDKGLGVPAVARAGSVESDDSSIASNPAVSKSDGVAKRSVVDECGIASGQERMASSVRRASYPFFANETFYCFFRLYQILCSRLLNMKLLSAKIARRREREASKKEAVNGTAATNEPKSLYAELLRAIFELLEGKMKNQVFEEQCSALFGSSGCIMYTVDKLVQSLIYQIQAIQADHNSLDLVTLYLKNREQPVGSYRTEAEYRLSARKFTEGEALYRLEYHVKEKLLTVELLGGSDPALGPSETLATYVNGFIEENQPKSNLRPSYLARNLEDSEKAQQRKPIVLNNLEIQVCPHTFKLFFVPGTEDVLVRPATLNSQKKGTQAVDGGAGAKKGGDRLKKFAAWVEQRRVAIAEAEENARKAAEEAAALASATAAAVEAAKDQEVKVVEPLVPAPVIEEPSKMDIDA